MFAAALSKKSRIGTRRWSHHLHQVQMTHLCASPPVATMFTNHSIVSPPSSSLHLLHSSRRLQQQQQPFSSLKMSQKEYRTTKTEQTTATKTTTIASSPTDDSTTTTTPNNNQLMVQRLSEIIKKASIPLSPPSNPDTLPSSSSSSLNATAAVGRSASASSEEEYEQLLTIILNLTQETKHESRKCEHMGRAVVKMCCADYLYSHFVNMSALQMEAVLNQFISPLNMMDVARALQLNTIFSPHEEYIEIDVTDENTMDVGVRGHERMVTGTLLRLIGAIYFTNGLHIVRRFISSHILSRSVDISSLLESFDPVKDLKELLRSGQMRDHAYEQLVFETVQSKGTLSNSTAAAEHNPLHDDSSDLVTVHARVQEDIIGSGSGYTKKIADMRAAQDALNKHYTKYDNRMTPIQLEQRQALLSKN